MSELVDVKMPCGHLASPTREMIAQGNWWLRCARCEIASPIEECVEVSYGH